MERRTASVEVWYLAGLTLDSPPIGLDATHRFEWSDLGGPTNLAPPDVRINHCTLNDDPRSQIVWSSRSASSNPKIMSPENGPVFLKVVVPAI